MLFKIKKQRAANRRTQPFGQGSEQLESRSMLTGIGGLELVFLVAQETVPAETREASAEFARGGGDVDVPDSLIWDIDSAG